MVNIVFDIGGSKMRVARVTGEETFSEPLSVATPQNPEEGVALLAELSLEVARGESIEKVAGGIAAVFNEEKTKIVNSSNLKEWVGLDVKEEFAKHSSARIITDNDSSVVGLGESIFGAGKGYKITVYMTVSTGVGGSRFIDGRLDDGKFGFEPGHQILNIETRETLEDLVSGAAFKRRFDVEPYEVTDKEVWNKAARDLAVGLHNSILHWSPEVLILGGPMIVGDPSIPIEAVKTELQNVMKIFTDVPEIKKGELQDHGGLYGGLVLMNDQD
ncbi:MAG: ROK family protein [Candidatus Campbellbacteria bacterium]|nr:ROK family protein [Candidatus Campbellbacteria bacterium]